jgi:acetyltransferase-like isoleucine patch superfamily enzyme
MKMLIRNIFNFLRFIKNKNIQIGDNTNISLFTKVSAGKYSKLIIGNNVLIAEKTSIFASNHQFREKDILINQRGIVSKGIVIEDDVWIGANCVILDGVKIAKGCVIGGPTPINLRENLL